MELRVLRYFLAVAREESITAAAQQLHVTQPTLSRQLMVEQVLACCGEREYDRRLQILCRYRCQLLEQVHEEQKKLDCLDYLIYTIKKQKKEKEHDL